MSTTQPSSFAAVAAWTALRLVAAYMFFLSGTVKIFSFPVPMPEGHTAELWSLAWFGGWIEIVGGALIALGLGTRVAAFVLSGMMAVAYFKFHAPQGVWYYPTANGGIPAVLYCFLWLWFAAAGAGPWSVDARICKR